MSKSSELLQLLNELKDSEELETLTNPNFDQLQELMNKIIDDKKFDKVPRVRFYHNHDSNIIHFINHRDKKQHELRSDLSSKVGWGNYLTPDDLKHMKKTGLRPRQWIIKYMNSEDISRHKIPIQNND